MKRQILLKLIFLFNLLFCEISYSQVKSSLNYYLKLTTNEIGKGDEQRQLFVITPAPKEIQYANVPLNFSHISIRQFIFDLQQSLYEKLTKGQISEEYWQKNLQSLRFSKPVLSKDSFSNNSVAIFTGLNKSGYKTIIVDANNNYNFGDDSVYTVKAGTDTSFKIKILGSYYNGKSVEDTTFSMLLKPNQNILLNNDTLQQRLGVTLMNNAILSAHIQLKQFNYKLAITKPLVPNRGCADLPMVLVTQFDRSGNELSSDFHVLNDTINLEGKLYKFSEMDFLRQNIKLSYLTEKKQDGTQVGDVVYNFVAADYLKRTQISPQQFKGKYILLDFWGTWCKPCIEGIPELVSLYKKYSENLEIISIANEKMPDLPKAKKLVAGYHMNWSNVWNDLDNGELTKYFKITVFPTYILIDKEGKIISKNEGIYSVSKIENLLKQ